MSAVLELMPSVDQVSTLLNVPREQLVKRLDILDIDEDHLSVEQYLDVARAWSQVDFQEAVEALGRFVRKQNANEEAKAELLLLLEALITPRSPDGLEKEAGVFGKEDDFVESHHPTEDPKAVAHSLTVREVLIGAGEFLTSQEIAEKTGLSLDEVHDTLTLSHVARRPWNAPEKDLHTYAERQVSSREVWSIIKTNIK